MKTFLLALLFGLLATFGLAQDYTPKPGETVLRLTIDGRGSIFIKLHTKEAPRATAQITRLARSGFYNGQRFHKVEKSPRPFMAQIGDPKSSSDHRSAGDGGSGTKVPFEDSGFGNVAGAVGLSTLPGDPNSGDSQFYMLMAASRFLDGKYTVFGQIVAGMDVLRKVELGDRLSSAVILGG